MRAIPLILSVLAGASVTVACITTPANEACAGNCLCFATPETCPIGCYPSYDILPDGGGTGGFSCSNAPAADLDAEALGATETPPLCSPPEGSTEEMVIPQSDLPTGACSGTESCSALVQAADCAGLVNGWTCSCAGGTWACDQTSMGTAVCVLDAGDIPGTDAAELQ